MRSSGSVHFILDAPGLENQTARENSTPLRKSHADALATPRGDCQLESAPACINRNAVARLMPNPLAERLAMREMMKLVPVERALA